MKTPETSRFHGIRYYPDPDDEFRYFYWAENPGPKLNADGRPSMEVYDMGTSVRLTLEVKWAPESDDLEALRSHLAEVAGVESARIKLSPAPFRVDEARLVLAPEDGPEQTLATSESSGMSPHGALFHTMLQGEKGEGLMNALAGGPTRLLVRYEGTLNAQVSAEAMLDGEIGALLSELESVQDEDAARRRVSQAVAGDELDLRITTNGPSEMRDQVTDSAIGLFAEQLRERARTGQAEALSTMDRLTVDVSLSGEEGVALSAETDVVDWFDRLPPEGHIHPAG